MLCHSLAYSSLSIWISLYSDSFFSICFYILTATDASLEWLSDFPFLACRHSSEYFINVQLVAIKNICFTNRMPSSPCTYKGEFGRRNSAQHFTLWHPDCNETTVPLTGWASSCTGQRWAETVFIASALTTEGSAVDQEDPMLACLTGEQIHPGH